MLWALLHLPFLLALLLLLRCVTDSLAATETIIGASIYVAIIDSIDSTVFGLFASGVSIDDYIESLRNATAFPDLSNFATFPRSGFKPSVFKGTRLCRVLD